MKVFQISVAALICWCSSAVDLAPFTKEPINSNGDDSESLIDFKDHLKENIDDSDFIIENPFEILKKLLKNGSYDARHRPNVFGKPVEVAATLVIHAFGPVNEKKFSVETDLYLSQAWKDGRLSFDPHHPERYMQLLGNDADIIWTPDLHFTNSRSGRRYSISKENKVVFIFGDGTVINGQRFFFFRGIWKTELQPLRICIEPTSFAVEFLCQLNLKYYPRDKQNCTLRMESYGHPTSDMIVQWYGKSEPVSILEEGMPASKFTLERIVTRNYTKKYFNSSHRLNIYSCLEVDFHLARVFTYYLFNIYAPSILLVSMTYASFFIPARAIPGRISLIVTNLLSTMFVFNGAIYELNRLDYRTYLDYFFLVNILFIISTMIEYICILYLKEYQIKSIKRGYVRTRSSSLFKRSLNRRNLTQQALFNGSITLRQREERVFLATNQSKMADASESRYKSISARSDSVDQEKLMFDSYNMSIDGTARVVFPVLYCIFLGVYAYLLTYSE